MRRTVIILSVFALISYSVALQAQITRTTFQGEMANKTFFLHLKIEDGTVAGFYKYQPDSLAVSLIGNIDQEGYLELTATQQPFSSFSGTLQYRTIKGTFKATDRAEPQPFYAINPRGDYRSNDVIGGFSISLSENGYQIIGRVPTDPIYRNDGRLLRGWAGRNVFDEITTHLQADGSIYLHSDSLNAKLYVNDSTLTLDVENGLPLFVWQIRRTDDGKSVLFTDFDTEKTIVYTIENRYDDDEFASNFEADFPENWEELDDSNYWLVREFALNEKHTARLRRINETEYIVLSWESAHLRHKPYQPITDKVEAKKMIGDRLRAITVHEDNYSNNALEVTHKDGVKQIFNVIWINWENEWCNFIKYYPEAGILILNHEADGDFPIDLNDSTHEHVGNPHYYVVSPNKQWRINGYHPGGAWADEIYWMEKWNEVKQKYEFISDLIGGGFYPIYYFYHESWFWTGNNKVLFKSNQGYESYVEMEIIEK